MALNFPNNPGIGSVYTDSTSGFSYEWTGVVWKSYAAANVNTIKSIDDISSGFNGSTQTFTLTSSGIAVYPVNDAQLIVNLGGVIQDSISDYNISGSNITFTTAPAAGLTFSATLLGVGIPVDYANSGNVYERQVYTATAGQTTFTFTAGYTPGYLDVYRNGVRLASGSDFTATSGSSFVLTTPALLNDEVEAIGYKVKTIVTSQGDVVNLNVTGIATISPSTFINSTGVRVSGVVTATSFNGNLTGNATGLSGAPNINVGVVTAVGGFNIGIQSAGNPVTTGVITAINFVGAGNTLQYNPSTKTVDISIAGGGGAIGTTGITTQTIFSNPNIINTPQLLTNPNHNYGVFGPVSIASTITVGVGNTFVVV